MKKLLLTIFTICTFVLATSCRMALGGGSGNSSGTSTSPATGTGTGNGGSSSGSTTVNHFINYAVLPPVEISAVTNLFSGLSRDSTVTLTGDISEDDLSTIAEYINDCDYKINLDLSGVTGISEIPDAFSDCSHLTGISLPATVTTIDYLSECGLEHITIPANSADISECAFWELINLESIDVSDSNPNYSSQDGILYNKSKTELIYFPNGKTGSYTIPETVETICEGALSFCENLTELNIPSSVSTIEENDFYLCSNLISINVDSSNESYSSQNGILYDKNKTTLLRFPRGKTTSYTIPDTVETIGENAFSDCDSLTNIDFPSSIKTIRKHAFRACTGLKNIIIPESVTKIEYGAFEDCSNLTQISISASVECINYHVFDGCEKLETVTFLDPNNWYSSGSLGNWPNKNGGNPFVIGNSSDVIAELNGKYLYKVTQQ